MRNTKLQFQSLLSSACLLGAVTLLLTIPSVTSADWLGFRGSFADGVADSAGPKTCDASKVAWSVDLPGRGVSSPIVVAGQVVVTASSGTRSDRLHVLSVDAQTGKVRWHRQFWATGRTLCHPTSSNAAPTPVSDGQHIVAFFSSNDVICLGLDGDLKWFRGLGHDYPKAGNDIGMASSPMLADGVLVCQAESQGDSFAEGLDVKDGSTLWRVDRPKDSNWTSPVLLSGDNDMVLLKCDASVSAHDLRSGEEVWKIDAEAGGIPSMVVTEKRIYVPGSTFMVLDRDADTATVAWESKKLKPSPSPSIQGDKIYMINSAGVLSRNSTDDGEVDWKVRVGGKYWASPIVAGDCVYSVNQAGDLTIVSAEDGEKLATYKFDDEIMGTPAISNNALFVRGTKKLYKVAN